MAVHLWSGIRLLLALLAVLAMLAPATLCLLGAWQRTSGPELVPPIPWGMWRMSALTAVGAGLVALLFAWPMARVLAVPVTQLPAWQRILRAALLGASLLLLVLPTYVVGQGLSSLALHLGRPDWFVPVFFAGQMHDPLTASLGSGFVGAATGWPLAAVLMSLPLRQRRASEAAVLATLPRRRLRAQWRVDGARVLPFAAAGAALVMVRMMLDTAAPQLLGQRAFAQEIWFAYSLTGGPELGGLRMTLATVAVVLPLVLVVAWLARGGVLRTVERGHPEGRGSEWLWWARKAESPAESDDAAFADSLPSRPEGRPRLVRARTRKGTLLLWGAVWVVCFVVPFAAWLASPHAPIEWWRILEQYRGAWRGTLWLGAYVAVLSALLGPLFLVATQGSGRLARLRRTAVWLAALVVFAWPPHASAFGMLYFDWPVEWSRGAVLQADAIRYVATVTIRLAPIALFAAWVAYGRVPRSEREAARALGLSAVRQWWLIERPRQVRAALVAGLVCGLLGMTDREITEVLAPVGIETLTARMFELLHFGADNTVLGLTLLSLGLTVAALVIAALGVSWLGGLLGARAWRKA